MKHLYYVISVICSQIFFPFAILAMLWYGSAMHGKGYTPYSVQDDLLYPKPQPDKDTLTVYGKVQNINGLPLKDVKIAELDHENATYSDARGEFHLTIHHPAILTYSLPGYQFHTAPTANHLFVTVTLYEEDKFLDSLIVTALGIKRKEIALPYSATKVAGEELLRNKDPNMITALAGKVAGVQVHKSASGIGGASQVLIRGVRTLDSNNQPLYVIDGIPILSASTEQAYTAIGSISNGGNRDGGDGVSDLNPEDVESITVLKGAPAAALYGGRAANGVILITTKRSKQEDHKITFSTSLTVDDAFCLPQFQNTYGESNGIESWGERKEMPAYDNAGDFFHTGLTSITALSLTTGSRYIQSYYSYAYTNVKGIVGDNHQYRHNITYRGSSALYNDKLKLDGHVNLVRQRIDDRPVSGGFYMNPLVGLYRFPRGKDIGVYKNQFEVYDDSRNMSVQNWHAPTQDFEQNPYWVTNRIHSKDVHTRIISSLSAEAQILPALKVQARAGMDYSDTQLRQQYYASTAPALAGPNGRYGEFSYNDIVIYGDAMVTFEKRMADFFLNVMLGGSIERQTINSFRYDSKTASLKYANVFNLGNILWGPSAYMPPQQIDAIKEQQSLFAMAQIGYKDLVYLDLTARNEWSSSLACTNHLESGYFYPSIGVSWIINRTFSLPSWISLAKVRIAQSKVGNDIPAGVTSLLWTLGAGAELQAPEAYYETLLEPEMTNAFEVGTEWRFLKDRYGVSFTYYKTNTKNQFFRLDARTGAPAAYEYVNGGNIQNTGIEIQCDATLVRTRSIQWKTTLTASANRNEVLELHDRLTDFVYGPRGFSSSYLMKLVKGGSVGDIYGKAFLRDENGTILYETEGDRAGLPKVTGEDNSVKVGNCQPKCNIGWQNQLRMGQFEVAFLIDSRFGGEILSQTQADLDLYGVTVATAEARDAGAVWLEGHKIENVEGFYKLVGGRSGVTEYYMYDATNIRLRELSVTYNLPQSLLLKTKVIKSAKLALTARNLFFIYKKAPFDPDLVLSTGNDNQGIEVYGMPTTRSMGFSLQCEF